MSVLAKTALAPHRLSQVMLQRSHNHEVREVKIWHMQGSQKSSKNGRETSKADVNFLVLGTHLESHLFVDWVCIDCFFSFLGHALGKNVC